MLLRNNNTILYLTLKPGGEITITNSVKYIFFFNNKRKNNNNVKTVFFLKN